MEQRQSKALAKKQPRTSDRQESRESFERLLANWLSVFGEQYRTAITPHGAAIYKRGLEDLTAEELDTCCMKALQECRFVPTVADIRAKMDRLKSNAVEEEAEKEWARIVENLYTLDWRTGQLRPIGERPLVFSEPAMSAVRSFGGFGPLGDAQARNAQWARKQFMEHYMRGVQRREELGLCDSEAKSLLNKVKEFAKKKLPSGE